MCSRGALIKFNFLSLDPIGFGDDARVMESSAFQQLCRMFHEMNILCFNQSWFSTLDPNPIVLFCSLCVTLYCHFTTPEILLADLFFFNLLHFYYLITLYNILFFFYPLLLFYIHLRSIICSLETKLNCFALLTALAVSRTRVRRRLLFVTLCSSRFMILPITTTTG